MKSIRVAVLAVFLFGTVEIWPQAQPVSAFEVASVKLAPPREGAAGLIAMETDPGTVRYSNITLKLLIAIAYGVDSRLIQGGPVWIDDQHYDVAARLPPGTSKDRVPAMLETLLVERFKLAVRRETTEQRVYHLVARKNGAKLKAAQKAEEQVVEQVRGDRLAVQILPGGITGHSMTLGTLAGCLARVLGYEVLDRTSLTGTFDINLKWIPDDSQETGPSLFTAIQEQLGLKLETRKAPVEVLRVEQAERIPTGN